MAMAGITMAFRIQYLIYPWIMWNAILVSCRCHSLLMFIPFRIIFFTIIVMSPSISTGQYWLATAFASSDSPVVSFRKNSMVIWIFLARTTLLLTLNGMSCWLNYKALNRWMWFWPGNYINDHVWCLCYTNCIWWICKANVQHRSLILWV